MSANIRPAGVFDTQYEDDIALNRTRADKFKAYGGFIFLLILPLLTVASPLGLDLIGEAWIGIINRIAILVIAVQGLNILMGYTGQISLGHAAFLAVGAYGSAILVRELGFSFWVALPVAALITGFVGLLFGLPSLRVKGFYLVMATLAAQFIIPWVLRYPMENLTNGARPLSVPAPTIGIPGQTFSDSISGNTEQSIAFTGGDRIIVDILRVELTDVQGEMPELGIIAENGDKIAPGEMTLTQTDEGVVTGLEYTISKHGTYQIVATPIDGSESYTMNVTGKKSISFATDFAIYYIIIPMSVYLMLAARNIIRTRVGRAFISIRDNDLAAELLGINVFVYKLQAFFISAIYAGIAGALMAFETNSLSLASFHLDSSIEMLAMLVVGGAGFPQGALFGVSFFNLLSQYVIPNIRPLMIDNLPKLLTFVDPVNIQAAVNPMMFGLILMAFLIIEPRGLAYRWEIFKIAWKIRPYSQH